jgi:protein transport protein SEC24
MDEYSAYHALGQGEQMDSNDSRRTGQPSAPQFQPPIAPNPYQQQGGYNARGQQQQQYYGSPQPPSGPSPQQQQGYFPPAGQGPYQGQDAPADPSGLAGQMGGLSMGAGGAGTARRKKKDRHAHHIVEAPAGSSQPYNGMPPAGTPATAYLNADAGTTVGGQFIGGMTSPDPNQFPAPVNQPFSPLNPASSAEFAARNGAVETPAVVPASGVSQVSPDDTPSVPYSRDTVQQYYLTNIYPTFERHVPPPATTSFVAFDQGNSSPKFTRLTMNNIPATAEGLAQTAIPLGLMLQPLAAQQPGELEIPVLDFGDAGPPRCRRCRAYINPFMMFRAGGNKFVCNLCGHPNDTPPEYYSAITPQGVRVDRDQRPELMRGTVEFTVPKEYWTKEPVPLRLLFVIDVTQEAFNKGFIEAFCDGILGALYNGADDGEDDVNGENGESEAAEKKRRIPKGLKVGFVTFDKEVHYYNCSVSVNLDFQPARHDTDADMPIGCIGAGTDDDHA